MLRKRTIAPEFLRDETLYLLETITGQPMRLIYLGLLMAADRRGVFEWRPLRLRTELCPLDTTIDMGLALRSLEAVGVARRYSADGGTYGVLMDLFQAKFPRGIAGVTQRLRDDEKPSPLPDPPVAVTGPEWTPPGDEYAAALREALEHGEWRGGGTAPRRAVTEPSRNRPLAPFGRDGAVTEMGLFSRDARAEVLTTSPTPPSGDGVGGEGPGEGEDPEDPDAWRALRDRAVAAPARDGGAPGLDYELPATAPSVVQAWAGSARERRVALGAVVREATDTERLHYFALVQNALQEGMTHDQVLHLCADWAGKVERGAIQDPSPRYFRQFVRAAWEEQRRDAAQGPASNGLLERVRGLLT